MKKLNPIEQSEYIEKEFREYIRSTFQIEDDVYEKKFKEELKRAELCKGPFLSAELPFKKGHSVRELVELGVLNKEFLNFSKIDMDQKLYEHQEKSIELINKGHNAVITTGTGSGKTESFLYPILNHILKDIEDGKGGSGIKALFLYPMNALVNDQMERIREILQNYPQITFGSYTGETEKKDSPNIREKLSQRYSIVFPKNEIVSKEEIRKNPPNLLFTNYSMLEHLLIRPVDFNLFNSEAVKDWQFVVLDEAHTYTGALGIEIALLLRRVTGIANKKPQFILTSATLGDEKKDINEIINFAESLTSSKYAKEDIVFAKRVPLETENISYQVDPKIYSEIVANIDNVEKIKNIVRPYVQIENSNDIKEILFELLIKDKNVQILYKEIKNEKKKTFKEVINEFNKTISIDNQQLIDLIQLITKANKNGKTIFDTRYHTFIRTLDGAFITLGKNKQIKLTNCRTIDKMHAFEIGLCKYCNHMYIIGKEYRNKLYQNTDIDIDENYGDIENNNVDYFLLNKDLDIEDKYLDKLEEYVVCSKCGNLYNKNTVSKQICDCGKEYEIELLKINNEKDAVKNNITECPCCTRKTNKGIGIVNGFHLSKDSATALLSQILYETLEQVDDTQNNKKEKLSLLDIMPATMTDNKEAKQFLAFSDSRQQASFFATFFEHTHKRFIRKRLIWEELKKNNHKQMKLTELTARLEKEIESKNLFDTTNSAYQEAWIAAMCELLNIDGNNSAEGLGIFAFKIKEEIIEKGLNSFKEEEIENFCNEYNITKDELIKIMQVIFEVFRIAPAISYTDAELTPEIKKDEFGYRRFDNYIVLKKEKGVKKDNRKSFMPLKEKVGNKGSNYIKRLFNEEDTAKINKFLTIIFGIARKTEILTEIKGKEDLLYQIDATKYVLNSYKNIDFFKCPVCKKITQYNVKNVCPTKNCTGKLEKCDPDEELKLNYYRKEYMNKRIERVVVKEHTAQLNKDTGREYQRKFKNKEINVLSCSTTFEMGVDIGKLENVFLRNVPPTPANYVQRAGRAGRRNDSSAFVLTFCGASSHDFTYFKDPSKMISGNIMPPHFKVNNDKIITRHLTASALGFFFNLHPEYCDDIEALICNNGIKEFIKYLKSQPDNLKKYIDEKVLDDETRGVHGNNKWISKVISQEGNIEKFEKYNLEKIAELKIARDRAYNNKEKKDTKIANYYQNEIQKILKQEIISSLSTFNIIPKYGFPVDVVELKIYNRNGYQNKINEKYNLSRDLSLAISEYAPDSEIIVDKKKYTSKYILKPRFDEDLTKYYYYECEYCERTNVGIIPENMKKCMYCGKEHGEIVNAYYVEPIYGFATSMDNKESTQKKPKKTYSGDYKYLGKGTSNNDEISFNNYIFIESTKDDELLVMNTNSFFKCENCGYTELDKNANGNQKIKEHNNCNGFGCNNKLLQKIALGHTFKTDVVKIKINGLVERRKALSTMYAILEGISEAFEIERRDINAILNKNDNGWYEFIVFDNVPGGAGHVKRILNQDGLKRAFSYAYKKVNMDCCDEETSCYNCLRNYYNQKIHKELKRRFAKEELKEIIQNIECQKENISLSKCINYNDAYSLDDFDSWDEIKNLLEGIEIEEFNEYEIKLADFINATIKLPNNYNVKAIAVWKNESIIIVNNDITLKELEQIEKYEIKVYKRSEINYTEIKEIIDRSKN